MIDRLALIGLGNAAAPISQMARSRTAGAGGGEEFRATVAFLSEQYLGEAA